MSATRKVPSYRFHKSSNRAVVTLNGRDFFLGRFNTDESRQKYDRLIGEWLAQDRRAPQPTDNAADAALTITELIAQFWSHAQTFYRNAEGEPAKEIDNFRESLQPVKALYGSTPAEEFGPLALKAVRQKMIDRGWCRSNINRHVARVRQLFKWAVSEELIPAATWHSLQSVVGLKIGRSQARESDPVKPVNEAHVAAVLPFLSRQVRAMIHLQTLTGMRPGEVCMMRVFEIDTSAATWTYKPQRHKTQHHGHDRIIYLGPQAQEILKPFLKPQTQEYLFSPADAEADRLAALHTARKTPMNQGNRPRQVRTRVLSNRYNVAAYRRAIARACDLAFEMPADFIEPRTKDTIEAEAKLPLPDQAKRKAERRRQRSEWRSQHVWHPHQLRHNAATQLRRQFGLDAAQVILGHKTLSVTQIYAEKNFEAAQRIMSQIG